MAKEDNKKDDVKKDDRLKALDAALSQIEKQYGKGSVMKLGDTSHMQVETVPTGSLSLDIALEQEVFRREELLRSTDRNPVVRPRLLFIW